MFNSTLTFIKESPAFTGPAVATVAACAMEIAALLKSHSFDVRSVAEAVEGIGPEIIAATSGAPGTLIVLAIDGRGRRASATVSADDSILSDAVAAADRAGHVLLGVNPAPIAKAVKAAHKVRAHAVH